MGDGESRQSSSEPVGAAEEHEVQSPLKNVVGDDPKARGKAGSLAGKKLNIENLTHAPCLGRGSQKGQGIGERS